ncbi:MAG: CBS domain-containing protein [Myxococcales bacterium]|nr:CBS domain-containing protein [Myxococcales bacterium]
MKAYDLKVADLMSTALLTVKASESVTDAHAEMELGLIRHLLVVDDRGKLVGVLSDRDLLSASKRHRKVAELMSRDVITVRPESPASEAAALMLDHRISSVPVVDGHGTLVGLVTQTDYLDLARRALLGLQLER